MENCDFDQMLLPFDWFCDCMKGVLVNFEDVHKLQSDHFDMKCGATIAISRLKYSDVRELTDIFSAFAHGVALKQLTGLEEQHDGDRLGKFPALFHQGDGKGAHRGNGHQKALVQHPPVADASPGLGQNVVTVSTSTL